MLEPEDKEYLKLVIESSMNSAMKPVHEHLVTIDMKQQEHDQLLKGVDGTNGLNGDVRSLKKFRDSVNLRIAWVAGGFSVAGAIGIKVITTIIGGK